VRHLKKSGGLSGADRYRHDGDGGCGAWIDRRIRDVVHYLWEAGRPDGDTSERVGPYSVVTLRFPAGSSESVQVTRFPDEDVPVVTPESPLGRALLGAQPGDEIAWTAREGRLRARVERVRRPA
jgi:transcription elongation factor GreA